MGQINLFATTLTPTMRDFLVGYDDYKLHRVALSRVLDESPFPHAYAYDDAVDHDYILFEHLEPLIRRDVTWLTDGIVRKKFECDKSTMMRYAIGRTLNKIGTREALRYKVKTDEEWAKVIEFRRLLEIPALALRHLMKSGQQEDMDVISRGSVLMIRYSSQETIAEELSDY